MPFSQLGITGFDSTNYTAARAALIDRLDAAVSTRLGSIKSIQTGEITMVGGVGQATATLTSVVVAKSIVLHLGNQGSAITTDTMMTDLVLTNSTTLTATRGSATNISRTSFMVIEFN